MKVFHAEESSI